jgi:ABC-2 type transport system permease protein
MQKILTIAWKDFIILYRDPGALIILLLTPFALTMVMNAAFGSSGGGPTLADIPVAIVNHDDGQFGQTLVELFESEDLATLVEPTLLADDMAARTLVDDDEAAAALIIPAGFSDNIIPPAVAEGDFSQAAPTGQGVIELYTNPTRPVSVGIVRGIVETFITRLSAGRAGGQVSMTQLIVSGRLTPEQARDLGQTISQQAGEQVVNSNLITIQSEEAEAEEEFNLLMYLAPSMAIFFLMFNVMSGGRSILSERDGGTLPRLLTTPTSATQVLAGKLFGTYLSGVTQLFILIAATTLLFQLNWGDPLALVLLVLTLVAAATAWGMLVAAYSRTPGQAAAVGTVLSLTFGIAAGNFIARPALPEFLRTISLITPNAWGLEGFAQLAFGGGFAEMTTILLALTIMAAVVSTLAILAFRRQFK